MTDSLEPKQMSDGGMDVVSRRRDDALFKAVGIVDSDQCAVVVDADEKVAAERVGKRDDFLFLCCRSIRV